MSYPAPSDLTLVSSNEAKIREYRLFAPETLQITPGEDLREVDGSADQVIIHKALAGGECRLVEDTILVVDGEPWIDVRWRIKDLITGVVPTGTPITWQVRLGVLWKDKVYCYLGQIRGVICPFTVDGNGMDPVFLIPEVGLSLAQLDAKGEKALYSARRLALETLIAGRPYKVIDQKLITPWEGAYQHE